MPSKSPAQARFMAACSHGADYPSCPPANVSHEFNQADIGKHFAEGGIVDDSGQSIPGPTPATIAPPPAVTFAGAPLPDVARLLRMAASMRKDADLARTSALRGLTGAQAAKSSVMAGTTPARPQTVADYAEGGLVGADDEPEPPPTPSPGLDDVASMLESVRDEGPSVLADYAKGVGTGLLGTLKSGAQTVLHSMPSIGPLPNPWYDQAGQTAAAQAGGTRLAQLASRLKDDPQGLLSDAATSIGQTLQNPEALGEQAATLLNPVGKLGELGPIAEMNAYHGSPYVFKSTSASPLGEFQLSKVGSGQGAQAFGHGIYLSENPKVAGEYAEQLAKRPPIPIPKTATPEFKAMASMMNEGAEESGMGFMPVSDAVDLLIGDPLPGQDPLDEAELLKAANQISKKYPAASNLYHVHVPDEHVANMLDWDAPLKQQPQVIQDLYQVPPNSKFGLKGSDLYQKISKNLGGPAQASAWLKSKGVPGLTYQDQWSRAAALRARNQGKVTRNLVLFDPKIATITKRATNLYED